MNCTAARQANSAIAGIVVLVIGTLLAPVGLAACPTTPSWAQCVGGKLSVDAGSGFGQIDFEDVTYQPPVTLGAPVGASDAVGCTPKDWLFYDSVYDGYKGASPPQCRSYGACGATDDLVHIWSEENSRNVLFKNVTIKNAFRSAAGQHMDDLQTFKAVDYGGWIVLQDSTFMNSDDENLQLGSLNSTGQRWNDVTTCESGANMGGLVLQNVSVIQQPAFISDCQARKGAGDYCGGVNGIQADNPITVWLINVTFSSGAFSIYEGANPVILVGANPSYGWVSGRFNGRRYYYDSIEDALAATPSSCQALASARHPDGCNAADFPHKRPPFINLSASGWKGAPSSQLQPPTLISP
jgi:hypothetical protein